MSMGSWTKCFCSPLPQRGESGDSAWCGGPVQFHRVEHWTMCCLESGEPLSRKPTQETPLHCCPKAQRLSAVHRERHSPSFTVS